MGSTKKTDLHAHNVLVAVHIRRRAGDKGGVGMDQDTLKDAQTDFYHLVDNRQGGSSEPSASAPRTRPIQRGRKHRRLQQHELSALIPNRPDAQRTALVDAMTLHRSAGAGRTPAVDVITLDGKILWDWDHYLAALDAGLRINLIPYTEHDPVTYLCVAALHERGLDAGMKALTVLGLCEPAKRGRPKKSTQNVDFWPPPKTEAEMAKMAGIGTTLISHAKELDAHGLSALVLTRQLKFNQVYQRLKLVQSAGLAGEVLDGTKTFGEAYLAAVSNSGNEQIAERETTPSRKALTDQVAELQRSVAKLTEENRRLRQRDDVLTVESRSYRDKWQQALRDLDEQNALMETYKEETDRLKAIIQLNDIEVRTQY